MSDGITDWYRVQRERELKRMTEEERSEFLAPKPRIEKVKEETPEHKPTREMNTYDDLTDDGIMYGEPPLWQQALVSLGDLVRLRWPVLQIALYCSVAFALGYYLGFR